MAQAVPGDSAAGAPVHGYPRDTFTIVGFRAHGMLVECRRHGDGQEFCVPRRHAVGGWLRPIGGEGMTAGDELDLDAVRRRAKAATHWTPADLGVFGGYGVYPFTEEVMDVLHSEDADFIAHARSDVPALLNALEAAYAEVVRLRSERASS